MQWLLRQLAIPAEDARRHAGWIRQVVAVHAAVEVAVWCFKQRDAPVWVALTPVLLCLPAAAFRLWPERMRRRLFLLQTAGFGLFIATVFPFVANHQYLVFVLLLTATISAFASSSELSYAAFARALTLIVLLHTGIQKALHGTYFTGTYLGWQIAHTDRFRTAFAPVLPEQELDRLTSLGVEVGEGPYATTSLVLLLASNAVWIAELLLPVALLFRKLRPVAVVAAAALVAVIELGAREFFFGILTLSLLASLLTLRSFERWAKLAVAAYLALGAAHALRPDWWFN